MSKKIGPILIFILLIAALVIQPVLLIAVFSPQLYHAIADTLIAVNYGYDVALYLILAILICVEIQNLEEFHIDKFTIITFILFSLLRRRSGVFGENYFLVLIGFSGITVAIALMSLKPKMPRTKISWAIAGMAIAGFSLILVTYLELYLRETWAITPLLRNSIPLTAISYILKNISSSALLEELLFRGFLWGYLRRQGFEENKIFWIQGLLFWLAHLNRIVTPFSFFIVLPMFILISSELTRRSKQIFPAILSHTISNAVSAMLNLATY